LRIVDLRSDTVTVPTEEMRRAMASAEVGDDVYGEDPTVNRLEELAAAKVGKEAALFLVSGTMANQVAIMAHTRRGDEILLESEAHIFFYEAGALAVLSGVQPRTIPGDRGVLRPAQVEEALRPPNVHFPPTSVVCLENTHNRAGGTCTPVETMHRIARIAHERGIAVHLDGARIFNAAIALGVDVKSVAAPADSVMFCLSKGLAAPVGSMLAGSRDFIDRARKCRKIVGGGMRQAGVIAAAGIVALERMTERLADDHRRARRLAEGLAAIDGLGVDPEAVETNIMMVECVGDLDAGALVTRAADEGVRCNAVAPRRIRLVTHKDVDDDDIEYAIQAFARAVS